MDEKSDNQDEMHRRVNWLKPSDRPILAEIESYGGWMKPATLALNLPYTRGHIARRCGELADNNLLERHDETAAYRLTDFGRQFLEDNLDAEDLQPEDK